MSLFEFLFTSLSGITFLLIGLSILGVFIYIPYISVQLYRFKKKSIRKTSVDFIIILGVIVFISGILNQIAGMIQALEMMIHSSEISAEIVMGGIIESFKIPIFCAFVLIMTLVAWYFLKKKWEMLKG
jgi:Sec-independent protein secretion pathway component TatC